MFISNLLPEKLKEFRKAKNLSQSDLARLLNISAQSISKWECGIAFPDIEKLCLLSEIFNVSIDTLIGHSSSQKKVMIAVDGGGTKTEFIMFSEDGVILEHLKLGACNPNAVGIEQCVEILSSGIDLFLNSHPDVCGIYIGAAGFILGNKKKTIKAILTKKYPHIPLDCTTDILNVIASSEITEDCIAVICGTGSSLLVKRGDDIQCVTGWGYLIDKWGSGFDIGRDAIYNALADVEGLGEHTEITDMIFNKAKMTPHELIEQVYKNQPSYIASFAPSVFDAYKMGDEIAEKILIENAKKMAHVINKTHKNHKTGSKVVLSGSLLTTNDVYRTMISKRIDPEIEMIIPAFPQIYGACRLCAEMCGVDTKPLHDNFMNQYKATAGK